MLLFSFIFFNLFVLSSFSSIFVFLSNNFLSSSFLLGLLSLFIWLSNLFSIIFVSKFKLATCWLIISFLFSFSSFSFLSFIFSFNKLISLISFKSSFFSITLFDSGKFLFSICSFSLILFPIDS
jgi:hypothetical protein